MNKMDKENNPLDHADYSQLDEFDFTNMEYETYDTLRRLSEDIRDLLQKEGLMTVPEIMFAHLCFYLGILMVLGQGAEQAVAIQPIVIELLKEKAEYAYNAFQKWRVTSGPDIKQRRENLSKMRDGENGSIVAQTVRLGKIIFDIMNELHDNAKIEFYGLQKKQKQLFCSFEKLIPVLKKTGRQAHRELKEHYFPHPWLFAIKQTAIQLGWLAGYYGGMDKQPPTQYMEYGVPCIKMMVEKGKQFLRFPIA